MLAELRVENLLLIERAELRLHPGLNVLTGETGAGKSVLAHALDLLLGGRPRSGIVRGGADEAYVEACFSISAEFAASLPQGCAIDDLGERSAAKGATGDASVELVLARRVSVDGRTRAYLNGRSAAVGDLRGIAERLISFHGQHEHRKLTDLARQLELLDALCGAEQQQRRHACAQALCRVRDAQAELEDLDRLRHQKDRELDLLAHELEEIETLDPRPGERQQLQAERERLREIDALRAAALVGAAELGGGQEDEAMPGAARLLASASARVGQVQGLDPQLDALGERCRALALEADDLAAELRRSGQDMEVQEGELEALEERLAEIDRLCRKHGGDLDAVLRYAGQARERRDALLGAELAATQATERLARAECEVQEHVQALRKARRGAARKLEAAMRTQLAALAMPQARFEVRLGEREPTSTGADVVDFMLAPNPGVPPGQLRQIASGGELSRVMLALSAIGDGLAQDSPAARTTLVFDEIDAGIGGHTARAVGERLRELARGRQVLCITHLPQIAAFGQKHFSIVKGSSRKSTHASVMQLQEREVVGELVRMLGAGADDEAAASHARELLKAA